MSLQDCKSKPIHDEMGTKVGEIVDVEEKNDGVYVTMKLSIDIALIYLLTPRKLAIKHLSQER